MMNTSNERLSNEHLINLPSLSKLNDDVNEADGTFTNSTLCSQKNDAHLDTLKPSLNYALRCKKSDEDENHDTMPCDIIPEDLQWNEQTWLPELSMNTDLLSNTSINNLSSCSFNTSLKELKQPLPENTQLETAIYNVDNPISISQSKVLSFLYSDNLNSQKNDEMTIIDEQNDNDTFYGLPNKVKRLLHKVRNITSLYDWQDECLKLESVAKRQNLIYTLPTSGGKTLVSEILMLKEILCNKKNVIFVLPYVAIVQEKIQTMAPFALDLEFLLEEYAGNKGRYPPVKRHRKNSIFICTIEKAANLINSLVEYGRLHEIGLLVVDELHLIGEGGGRGATLERLLTELISTNGSIHIVGMSATIGNLNEIATFLKADVYTKNFRPIQLKEYVKCENRIWLVDLHDKEIFTDEKKINYRYSEAASKLDPDKIGGLVMDIVPNDSCLIFCSSRKNCENVAMLMTRVLFRSLTEYKVQEKDKLLNDLKAEDNLCPILLKTIKYGVAYHHSGLTTEERRILEDAYRDGTICVICCTTTLAAGVNLPARRVIIRSPYIGREFINLSRYKQMIGRAGRAGMGEIGESILICKSSEMPKIQTLLTSKMEDCISNLNTDEDRGINNLIMSSVMLSLASTKDELHQIVSKSLLGIQSSRLGIKTNDITDLAITKLMKEKVLKVKTEPIIHGDTAVLIQPPIINTKISKDLSTNMKSNERSIITRTKKNVLELSDLGKAAMKGCIDLQSAYNLYDDLKMAQNHLVLINDLHILYLVTPYDLTNQFKPIGSVYYDVVSNLSSSAMAVARVLGINEVALTKLRDGVMPKNIESRVANRFYSTLILYDLWQRQSLFAVSNKYQINRGAIQNLLTSAGSFAISIAKFCQELSEFWAFTDLFTQFNNKLNYYCSAELGVLMELPAVKVGRAKQLYNAGFKTLQSIALANPQDLTQKIAHVSQKMANEMIAAANLLLLAKVENLKDEVAEMMESMETSIFSCN
ncbi:hypothetical protein PV328_010310 [Microctonus aethiopoides]|uniref:Helicase POLQ-like n=1 Tax=Microctonus aethiopoides TaxID=144406 RepID=A0AA39F1D1_9HYME|nr:hypothetical protein PV328_010310 [Microctonus aethiopoides]